MKRLLTFPWHCEVSDTLCSATMFIGFPFVTILFTIPQFGQAVYGLEPIPAALSILPLLLSSPAAIVISGVLTSNYNVAPAHLIIVGSVIQMVGVGLTIDIPLAGSQTSAKQYGFETIMGLGFGMTLGTVLTLAQLISSKEDVGMMPLLFKCSQSWLTPTPQPRCCHGGPDPNSSSWGNGIACYMVSSYSLPDPSDVWLTYEQFRDSEQPSEARTGRGHYPSTIQRDCRDTRVDRYIGPGASSQSAIRVCDWVSHAV